MLTRLCWHAIRPPVYFRLCITEILVSHCRYLPAFPDPPFPRETKFRKVLNISVTLLIERLQLRHGITEHCMNSKLYLLECNTLLRIVTLCIPKRDVPLGDCRIRALIRSEIRFKLPFTLLLEWNTERHCKLMVNTSHWSLSIGYMSFRFAAGNTAVCAVSYYSREVSSGYNEWLYLAINFVVSLGSCVLPERRVDLSWESRRTAVLTFLCIDFVICLNRKWVTHVPVT
jgi:hypothetical protein